MRIFDKVGLAYGYIIENAYLDDRANGVEFLLTATTMVNKNGILGDGEYEYEELGFSYVAELGRVIYDYELRRERTRQPDLGNFGRPWAFEENK